MRSSGTDIMTSLISKVGSLTGTQKTTTTACDIGFSANLSICL
eukprot:gene23869-32261_t